MGTRAKATTTISTAAILAVGTFVMAGTLMVAAPQAQAKAYSQQTVSVTGVGSVYAFSNGKTAFYTKTISKGKQGLYKYTIKNKKVKKLKTLKSNAPSSFDNSYWSVANVYKGKVYLNYGANESGFKGVYRIKASGGKLKKIKNAAKIVLAYGSNKYVAVTTRAHSDVSAEDYTLYKVNNGTLKKLKKIATHGFSLTVVGKKLYFTRSTTAGMSKTSLYRCSFTGKSIKKLGGPWQSAKQSWGGRGQALVNAITSKRCTVTKQNARGAYIQYTYTYKTKKLVRA